LQNAVILWYFIFTIILTFFKTKNSLLDSKEISVSQDLKELSIKEEDYKENFDGRAILTAQEAHQSSNPGSFGRKEIGKVYYLINRGRG
jgi:hypothetical protein